MESKITIKYTITQSASLNIRHKYLTDELFIRPYNPSLSLRCHDLKMLELNIHNVQGELLKNQL